MVDGIVITGPTASGKTALAVAVAKELGGEIISMDSRQVYRRMDIGTAKVSAAERAAVPHYGLDLIEPSERYNAGRFAADARRWMADISGRGKVPILSGGTGFFLRSLTHPMFDEPAVDERRKEFLKHCLAAMERAELVRWLEVLDHESAAAIGNAGPKQRLARAVEVVLLTGRKLSTLQRECQSSERPMRFRTFILDLPRDVLYDRINLRVDHMLESGLVDEVRNLVDAGFDASAPGMKTVGYRELLPYLNGEYSLEEAAFHIRRKTRGYARRQMTWFRHQMDRGFVVLDGLLSREELVRRVCISWQRSRGAS